MGFWSSAPAAAKLLEPVTNPAGCGMAWQRWFSVVATEVRNLSFRASDATREIGEAINRIRNQTSAVSSVSKAGSEEMQQLAEVAETAQDRLMSLIDLAGNSSAALGNAALQAEIELANLEELEIKLTVYQILAGLSDRTADSLPSEKECRLGQWYCQGGGNEQYSGRVDFKAV